MLEIFFAGGPFMWILLFLLIVILATGINKTAAFYSKNRRDSADNKSSINTILFLGVLSAVLGFFAHLLGLYSAAESIARATDISPQIVIYGFAVSLIPAMFSLIILIISGLIWYLLYMKQHRLQ